MEGVKDKFLNSVSSKVKFSSVFQKKKKKKVTGEGCQSVFLSLYNRWEKPVAKALRESGLSKCPAGGKQINASLSSGVLCVHSHWYFRATLTGKAVYLEFVAE